MKKIYIDDVLTIKKYKLVEMTQNFIFTLFFMVVTYRIIFYNLSFLSQVLLFLFILIGAKGILKNIKSSSITTKKLLFFNFIGATLLILYALIYQNNEPSLIIRFYLIANLLILAFFYPVNSKMINLFLYVIFFQALFVVGFELFMIMNFEAANYGPVRFYIQEIGIGDVYTYDGKFWRIQLAGNHLLPLGLFISIYSLKGKQRLLISSVFLLASVFSGHFAFLIAIFIFATFYYILNNRLTHNNIVKLFLLFILMGIIFYKPAYNYVSYTIDRKSEGSLSTRGDQLNVLVDDMSNSIPDLVVGKGYGNTVNTVTNSRDYRDAIYYELQTFYLLNQFGFIYMLWFVFLNIYFVFLKLNNKNIILIYSSFIIYGFTNPYMFDSSHIFIIVMLLSLHLNITLKKVTYGK